MGLLVRSLRSTDEPNSLKASDKADAPSFLFGGSELSLLTNPMRKTEKELLVEERFFLITTQPQRGEM